VTVASIWRWMASQPFRPAERRGPSIRLHEIDGLRGWAALSVVVYHMFWATFGVLMPWICNPVTGFLLDGGLAVAVFFVLSGEALSSAYFNGKGDVAVIKLAVKRYPRLTIPIAATCAIVFILGKLGAVHNVAAAQLVHRPEWLGAFLQIPLTLKYYAKFALLGTYQSFEPPAAVDPFLWTMQYELIGSVVVFAVLLSFRYIKWPWVLLGIAALLLLIAPETSQISCFLFGIAFSCARMNGGFAALQKHPLAAPLSYGAIILLAAFDGYTQWKGILHARMALFAVPMVFAVFCNKGLCNFFANRVSRILGTLSFPIYLVQFPILMSFTSIAIVYAAGHGGLTPISTLTIATLSVLVCLLAAYLFTPVEAFTKLFGNRLTGALIADPEP
jgi:peptidoglycan/LPS O-acetylase OafA/YrhL